MPLRHVNQAALVRCDLEMLASTTKSRIVFSRLPGYTASDSSNLKDQYARVSSLHTATPQRTFHIHASRSIRPSAFASVRFPARTQGFYLRKIRLAFTKKDVAPPPSMLAPVFGTQLVSIGCSSDLGGYHCHHLARRGLRPAPFQ